MSHKLTVAELLERNKVVAENHKPIPTFPEFPSLGLDKPRILVLTCADPRCSPEYFLNLKHTEGVIIVRNVCGHANYALNDILALDRLIDLTDVLVIHHTDCGSLYFTDDQVRAYLKERASDDKSIDSMFFGGITDVEQSVKDDLAMIKSSPYMRRELAERTQGFVYDIKTGKLNSVKASAIS